MKYKYIGDYEEAHLKVKLVPGEIVELPSVPARLQSWLVPVTEKAPVKAVEPAPVKAKKPAKVTKPKKKQS